MGESLSLTIDESIATFDISGARHAEVLTVAIEVLDIPRCAWLPEFSRYARFRASREKL